MDCGRPQDEDLIAACIHGMLGAGRILRFEVYDHSFNVQGEAAMEITEQAACTDGFAAFSGKHVAASDEGYEQWAKSTLADPSKNVFHLCGCHAWECCWSKRSKRIVHISKWKVTSLAELALESWSSAMAFARLKEKIHAAPKIHLRRVGKQPPAASPPNATKEAVPQAVITNPGAIDLDREAGAERHGQMIREALRTGRPNLLEDGALEGIPSPGEEAGDKPEEGALGKLGRKPAKEAKRQKVQATLAEVARRTAIPRDRHASCQEISSGESERGRPEKRRKRDKRGRKRKRSSSRCSSSSRSSCSLRIGGRSDSASLAVTSKQKPGRLLKSGLAEMRQYLLDLPGGGAAISDVGVGWRETKVGAYVSQVMFLNHPPESMGLRNAREVVTLSTALDLLLTGQLGRLGDVLMQRLKAVEASLTEGWSVAKHYELIPPAKPIFTSDKERDYAAKAALKAAKLKEALQKATVKGSTPG